MFPDLPPVQSGLRTMLLNPDLQMQDLIDQSNTQAEIPASPVVGLSVHGEHRTRTRRTTKKTQETTED